MSISIGSDLVMDSIRASDPQKVQLARARLGNRELATNAITKFQNLFSSLTAKGTKVSELPNDLVADVMKAADPEKKEVAIAKFGFAEPNFAPNATGVQEISARLGSVSETKRVSFSSKQDEQFEAMVLRNFVEDMMPKATPSLYGEGTAGNIWRSMQADFMSQEMAKSDTLGIAKTLGVSRKDVADATTSGGLNRIMPSVGQVNNRSAAVNEWPYFRLNTTENEVT